MTLQSARPLRRFDESADEVGQFSMAYIEGSTTSPTLGWMLSSLQR